MLICDQCGKKFALKSNLSRHVRSTHAKVGDFVCDTCSKRFFRSDILKRHINGVHLKYANIFYDVKANDSSPLPEQSTIIFECNECGKSFLRKKYVRQHIMNVHMRTPRLCRNILTCHHCSLKFKEKDKLRSHIQNIHMKEKHVVIRAMDLKCLKCDNSFPFRRALQLHYGEVHKIVLEWKEFELSCTEGFQTWKKKMQLETITQFILLNSWNTTTHFGKKYICHRSGTYIDYNQGKPRKRLLKAVGSKRLQGYCPAEINIKINRNDGTCSIKFQAVHVGHPVCDANELRHIYLDEDDRLNIANRMLDGVPVNEIQLRQCLGNKENNCSRLSLLTNADIHNIAATYNVAKPTRHKLPFRYNELNVKSFVEQHKESILFCKFQDEFDTHYPDIKEDDFVIVFMNRMQEDCLKRYSYKVITFDGTRETNPCDFVLHSLLVLDVNQEGIPAAFLLSNRRDENIINVFLQFVRDRVGALKPHTLMTDMDPMYYNSWLKWMSPPENHLFSVWHVYEDWRRNSKSKITDVEKRNVIQKQLQDLGTEMDQGKFEIMLIEFQEKLQTDPDLYNFEEYFKKRYLKSKVNWAYCYHKFALLNTNMHVETFHRVLKKKITVNMNIKSLQEGLHHLYTYLSCKENDMRTKAIRCKASSKRLRLRKRHCTAAINETIVQYLENGVYLVGSFEKQMTNPLIPTLYKVEKLSVKECSLYDDLDCQLPCILCKTCYHEYRCECKDSCISQNMCKHIHALALHFLNNSNLSCENMEILVKDEDIFSNMEVLVNDDIPVNTKILIRNEDVSEKSTEVDVIEEFRQKMIDEFTEAISLINSLADLQEIHRQFVFLNKTILTGQNKQVECERRPQHC